MSRTLKQTGRFRLYVTGNRTFVRCKRKNHHPAGRRVSQADSRYLLELSTKPDANGHSTFDSGCIELGVGVWA